MSVFVVCVEVLPSASVHQNYTLSSVHLYVTPDSCRHKKVLHSSTLLGRIKMHKVMRSPLCFGNNEGSGGGGDVRVTLFSVGYKCVDNLVLATGNSIF